MSSATEAQQPIASQWAPLGGDMSQSSECGSLTIRFTFDPEKDLIVPVDSEDSTIKVPSNVSAINIVLEPNPDDRLDTVFATYPIQWVERRDVDKLEPIPQPLTFLSNRIDNNIAIIADFHFDVGVGHHFVLLGLRGDKAVSSLDPTIVNEAPPQSFP